MSSKMLLQATTSPLAPLLVGEGKRVLQCLTDIKMHPFSYQEKGVGMSSKMLLHATTSPLAPFLVGEGKKGSAMFNR